MLMIHNYSSNLLLQLQWKISQIISTVSSDGVDLEGSRVIPFSFVQEIGKKALWYLLIITVTFTRDCREGVEVEFLLASNFLSTV